ncbi:hypothetical protein B0T20DRAFT_481763 [Sordaria brevicollis]|uniref:Uncharacterized protein n=1 Tax=Sordaria brevicollis TaxID=83679 RepID=A0AAE0P8T9_SORBR|nr:hypothetical protein B0T20DRAFT_481763 [Sordaria brevicollis]
MPGQRRMYCKGLDIKEHRRIDPFHASSKRASEIVHPRPQTKPWPRPPRLPRAAGSVSIPNNRKLKAVRACFPTCTRRADNLTLSPKRAVGLRSTAPFNVQGNVGGCLSSKTLPKFPARNHYTRSLRCPKASGCHAVPQLHFDRSETSSLLP